MPFGMRVSRSVVAFSSLVLAGMLAGCAVAPPEDEGGDAVEPANSGNDAVVSGTVNDAVSKSCSTTSIKPLSQQIINEIQCMVPGSFAAVPQRPNVVFADSVFPYLDLKAKDAFVATLDAHPSTTMHVDSMFRTVAQQYLLYRWYQTGRCGIPLAASPGNSNHETGLAIDVSETSTWRSALGSHSLVWFGSADQEHYTYEGAGAVDQRGLDVKAFQRLWNRNNAKDQIAEDGDYGPITASRIKASPAAGFPIGAVCNQSNGNASSSSGSSGEGGSGAGGAGGN